MRYLLILMLAFSFSFSAIFCKVGPDFYSFNQLVQFSTSASPSFFAFKANSKIYTLKVLQFNNGEDMTCFIN